MKKIFLVIIISILFTLNIPAFEPMPVNEPGDLKITVFITDSIENIEEWLKTPYSHSPTIKVINETKYNEIVYAGFMITGFTKDNTSKVNILVGVQVRAPNKSVLMEENEWATINNTVLIEKGIILCDPMMDMIFEEGDQIGNYEISAFAIDILTGKRTEGSVILKVFQNNTIALYNIK